MLTKVTNRSNYGNPGTPSILYYGCDDSCSDWCVIDCAHGGLGFCTTMNWTGGIVFPLPPKE